MGILEGKQDVDSFNITERYASPDRVTDAIRDYVTSVIGRTFLDDEDFFESGGVTSLFGMQIIGFVERAFDIEVLDDDLDIANFRSVSALSEFVSKKKVQA